MAQVPVNERLWNSLVTQAKAKFGKWPSLPASKWVHTQYVQRGGRFVDAKKVTERKRALNTARKKNDK